MVKDGEPYLIDFQGGRKGPLYYDVASFLWQAKANYPDSLRQELIDEYLEALRPYKQIEKEVFLSRLRHVVLFRTLQVLGAYGFRGYFEKKTHFIESIPFAIENLRQLLQEGFPEYPYLCEVLQRMTELKQFAAARNRRNLTVTVMSFSYRKGIPADESGNGGGYVFDCRAVHQPRTLRAVQIAYRTEHTGHRVFREGRRDYRIPSSYRRSGGCPRAAFPGTWILAPDDLLRMYRRAAPLCVLCPTHSSALA